jgi:serine/threonine-protein kinase
MLHLKAFGGLSVAIDDAPAVGAAQQRKTLALLAMLAVAGRSGLSRDKLVAYLWPEADAEHARGLLKQACYALRRDLQRPDLFLGTTQLTLNPAAVTSDVQAFEAALERHDDGQAAALYTGPFLDGFYLHDSLEFERWVEGERERLRQRVGAALERLAAGATTRGDHVAAVEWWRRLSTGDPLNSRATLGLMNALVATGDRAGALRVAQAHESLAREELGAASDPAIASLTGRLRTEGESWPVVGSRAAPIPAMRPNLSTGVERRARMARKPVIVGVVLVVAGVLTGTWLALGTSLGAPNAATVRQSKRVVVLPFTNLGLASDAYFANGIAEEITARLAAIHELGVIGATSAQASQGRTITEIGKQLGVDYVLEGSVRWQRSARGGTARVRVTPQLVRVSDGTHLWAQIYDEPLDEIFRVQSDIAGKVVQALDVTLLESQRRIVEDIPTRNLEAYDYYLRGKQYSQAATEERVARAALQMYEKAVALDPSFAQAHAMVARMNTRLYMFYWDRSEQRLALAKRAVDRAFELDPELPDAHHSLGAYYFIGRFDYERALREFAIADSLRPNDRQLVNARAVLRQRQGQFREALVDAERAWALDSGSSQQANSYAQHYHLLREFERAEPLYDRAIALAPDRSLSYFWKAGLYLRWDGDTRRARSVLESARSNGVQDDPLLQLLWVTVDMFDGRYEDALRRLGTGTPHLIEDQFRFVPRAQLYAQVYGLMQRRDLERAYYDSARALVFSRVQAQPADARFHSALGIAYAGLGRKQQAIDEARRGAALLPVKQEAFQGYYREWDLAQTYTMVGDYKAALATLEHLLSIPGHLTSAWLRIDPVWDPLRGHPRFQRLVDRRQ